MTFVDARRAQAVTRLRSKSVDNRPERCDNVPMNGREFIRRAGRYARRNGLEFHLDTRQGKGSHQTVHVGGRHTRVQHGEIAPRTLASMFRDLSIDRIDRREF